MACVALVAAVAVLLMGAASGARLTGRNPYWLGDHGGVTVYVYGEGFSEDQFSQFDPTLGNRVYLVNDEDEIECKVIRYLTTTSRITCSSGPRTKPNANRVYDIIVYVDGVRAEGSVSTVQYGSWTAPVIQSVTPHWSLPGGEVTFNGWLQTDRYYKIDYTDPLATDFDSGHVITKVYLGGTPCDVLDENEEPYGALTTRELTCRPRSKLSGPMNATVYVTGRGASGTDMHGKYVDSQDKLFQYHTYPGVNSVSLASGSSLGGSLLTINGVGFDPYMEQTKVEVGGAKCAIQDITDDQIQCLTPAQDLTSAGPGERGMLVELYEGKYFEADFWTEESWAALSPSDPGYRSFVTDVAELKFPIDITQDTVGTVKGYLHPPHDGLYALAVSSGDHNRIMLAADGNPDNMVQVNHWEEFTLEKGTPAYLEIRFRSKVAMEFNLIMKDLNAKFVWSQTSRARNERHRVRFNIVQKWEKQKIVIEGNPAPVSLFMNGISSAPVDISDSAQVQEQLLDMTEQKCEADFSGLDAKHHTDFEDDTLTPGGLGSFVNFLTPYCGRSIFKLRRTDPRIYRETDENLMVDANTHRYICFAVTGNMETSMAVNFKWQDKNGRAREDTFWFDRAFSSDSSSWTYWCEDLVQVMLNSWAASQYNEGAKLKLKNMVLPKPLTPTDDVYIDEVVFLTSAATVIQTRPSALKQQGILVEEVRVLDEEESGYTLEFITTNCMSGMPLLGVFEGEADNSLIGVLAGADSYDFAIGDATVKINREATATQPLSGTWDLTIQGQLVKDIDADVHPNVLNNYLESALGTDLTVTYSGSCRNYYYNIEWLVDPGRKDLVELDDTNLVFDGEDVEKEVTRNQEGLIWHNPLPADFLTTYRDSPHVTVRVNGYSAACLGDCSFSYDDSVTPTLTSVSGTPGEGMQHTLILTGTDFTSSSLDDYSVSVGDRPCSPTGVTTTEVTCDVALWAGEYTVTLSMQPAGVALSSSPVTYTVSITVSSLSISTGGTGGLYPLTVSGSGFPDAAGWEAGSAKVMMGSKECVVTSGSPTEVTCTVPPGEGVVDVLVDVGGTSDSLPSSFTYDASLSPAISDVSLASFSVYGQEELTISGSSFGSSGSVKIGPESCDVTSWSDSSVTCLTPSLSPGSYSLILFADSMGAASRDVEYVLKVTSTSATKGSVKGGTLLKVGGMGFGTDCSRLEVKIGEHYECEVLECSANALTCRTKFVPTTHVITNTGSTSEESVSWAPRLLEVAEGDLVTWQWSKLSETSQLKYSVCEVESPVDSCEDADGSGFSSGPKTAAGSLTVSFPQQGVFYYAGFPVSSSASGLVMRGQINVVRPQHRALKVTVALGDKEATYDVTGDEVVSQSGCDPILESPIAGCEVADPTTPADEHLYFQAHTCYTPVVTAIATSTTHSVPGLSGIQVIAGESLTITGSGFGDLTCQMEVSVGDAECSVTSVSDTSVSCDLDDLDNLRSSAYLPVTVKAINRGIAITNIDDYSSLGRVVVVPEVTAISPSEGSLGGGTLLTITGTGLQGLNADPVVLLGGKACEVQSVSSTSVTCLTPASATATTATLILAVSGVPAKMEALTFTYNEALTPMVTGMSIESEEVTLAGQRLGSDSSKLTVTLERQTVSRKSQDVQEEEEELIMEKEEIDEYYFEEFMDDDDDDEMEHLVNGYLDEETVDAIRSEKSRRRHLSRRLKLSLADELEAPEGFWGTFTGTGAATFEESVRMGAWRMAGTALIPKMDDEDLQERSTRRRRSAEDLPTSYDCTVTSVSGSEASCTCSGLPAGSYTVAVSLDGAGNALAEGVSAVAAPVASSMTPASGSTNGGALLAITGSGFIPGDTSVLVGGVSCPIEDESTNAISCRVAPGSEGSVAVVVKVTGSQDVTAPTDFTYSSAFTPTLSSVTPSAAVVSGDTLTFTGTGFTLSGADPVVTVGGEICVLTSNSDTSLECTVPEVAGGSYEVMVRDTTHGDSNTQTITFTFSISSITPSSGSFGGAEVILTGQGFDPAGGTTVTICGEPCDITSTTSTTGITCVAPKETLADAPLECDVVVTNPSSQRWLVARTDGSSASLPGSYTYDPALTPSVTSVEPKRGGTAGGTTLTIVGTSFGSSGNVVTIGGSPCVVSSQGPSSITCVTEAHQGTGRFEVKVTVPGKGLATTDENGIFYYIDRWSSMYTWDNKPAPSEGQLAVVSQDQIILLDESTPVLKMLLIRGGHVIFDSEATEELVLRAEYILVVDGGSLSIGSEEEPFTNPAVIELHGNTQSVELPIYGAKVLAVRNGTLDLHGAHVPITWTHLAQTASSGDTTITLALPVTWKPDDQIVVATTEMRFSKNENEVRTIASVSADGLEVTLTEPLEHTHISLTQTLGGRMVETRAEVGLLSRNVKIRGAINSDFTEVIEGCEEMWTPDQFDTQTCFNGRFGDEIGSDQFGATVMLFGKYPDQELVTGRIEYVEVTEAGQAFQLGRYPLHFHLVGNVDTSYIRGCAVHRTYNRAITIHAANFLTIEHNVVYDNMGHAIFTEDGVEQNNVVQYNLAVYTRTSSSLLNVDVTPSSFWVVNPNNIFRHNAAAGGTHFGYWYRVERHPTGPSATNSYCPNNQQMGEFFNNTAHSMGRYGLWVFSMDGYHPKSGINCGGSDLVAEWHDFTAWYCDRGAEVVFGTNLQFHNFVMLDNEHAGMEMVKVEGGFGEDDGPGIFNSLVVGHSGLGSGSCGDGTSGIIAPKQYLFSIADVTFVNFDTGTCSALSGCSQCKERQGGFRSQVKGLTFDSSPNKLKFKWEHETIWIDADGSLTGTAEANVVPSMGILPPASCSDDSAFSVNSAVPGAVCNGLKFLRINVEGPDVEPESLQGRDLIISNDHGSSSIPYRVKRLTTEGWMGIVYAGGTFDWSFDYSEQITNISYEATTRFLSPDDYFYVRHTFMQEPDGFGTTSDERVSLESLPDPSTNIHGDYYWDTDAKELTYMVSHNKEATSSKRSVVFDDRDTGSKRDIDFRVYRCQYEGCVPPTPPPVPTGRPDTTYRWSNVETWKEVPVGSGGHPTETEYNLPVEGDEIIIPKGMWLIVDTATPKLDRVYVYGTLEFENTMDHDFEATIIYIQGGTVVAGFSSDDPFTYNLVIRLRGSLDPNDPDNEDFPMPPGVPNVGWKAIGVFGNLKLHGQVSGNTWHKLGATAESGTNTVTLAEAPDASWLDKMVVVTSTSKEATESEVRKVTAINDATLTLDSALTYQHIGETHTLEDGTSITLAAEVGLLSHNIVVEGNTYENFAADSFGARIVVSKFSQDGMDYIGTAQLDGVELRNVGQEGFTDLDDPRFSLAYVGLGTVEDDASYVKRSSFNLNYNVALGLLGTTGMQVQDNVIYYAINSGIRDESGSNTYTNNLITTVLFLGTYGDRLETQNLNWYGAFHLDNAPDTVLTGNIVAGAEQAGYKTFGEPCEDGTLWTDNEVHNTVYGVMSWKKGSMGPLADCRRINNFYAWRISATAFYYQYYASSLITDVTSVDNALGVNQLVALPPALSHTSYPKTATTKNSLFVGASPSHTCTYQESTSDIITFYEDKLWNSGVDGGNTALLFGTFMSGSNMAPKHPFSPTDTYPALYGSTHIEGVTFSNYDDTSCGRDIALLANPDSDDAIHPVFVEGLTFLETPEENYLFIPRANVEKVDPSDCVDMDCDGHKKVVIRDMDGTLLGTSDASVISQAEYEWDGDPRRGVGDYRIPVSLRQREDGSEIEAVEKFPNKGIVRDSSCSVVPSWQAWKCSSLSYRMMVIESMDSDTEVRRLSPIALIANPGSSGYVDLLNGPMDRGWCFGYTCQERISTFYSVVAAGQVYEMAMTSSPPQLLRLHLLHAPSSEAVVLRIFFPKPQRYDIYVDGSYVPPTNIDLSAESYQLIPENPDDPDAFFPTLDNDVGSNYFQRSAKLVHVVVKGGHVIDIKTTPMITLTSGLVVAEDEFFEQNLLANLADLLGVSTENIRITNIVREDSRRRNGRQATPTTQVSAEVASAPTTSLNGEEETGATKGEVLSFEKLKEAEKTAINKFQEGSCEACVSFKAEDPIEPPKEAPPKATPETGSVVIPGGELFSNKQQKEDNEALEESMETTEYVQPSSSMLLQGVSSEVVQYAAFEMQPSVAVLDDQGETVNDLGAKSDPWKVTAQLSGGPENAVLKGTTTVPYVDGAATFTDLSVSQPGEGYSLTFTITYPSDAPALSTALDQSFSARAMKVGIKLQYPAMLQAGQPMPISVQFVDQDSLLALDEDLFKDQTVVGEVMAKDGNGEFEIIKRIYSAEEAASAIPINDLIIENRSVRYHLSAKVSVVPVGWYLETVSPPLVVYPDYLAVKEGSVSKTVVTHLNRKKMADDAEEQLADGMLTFLMESVDMMADGVYFSPANVTFLNQGKIRGKVEYKVFASEDDMETAMDTLCRELHPRLILPVKKECRKSTIKYVARKVIVDDKLIHCWKKNNNKGKNKNKKTLSKEAVVQSSLHQPARFGRHKFNRR